MSGFSTPSLGTPMALQKNMSSRLANMKFMQRGSASDTSKPSTPTSQPTSKRVKTEHNSTPTSSVPGTPLGESPALLTSYSLYQPEGLIETQWTLAGATQVANGVQQPDRSDEDHTDEEKTGRQSFGEFKRKKTISSTTVSTAGGASHGMRPVSDSDDESNSDSGEVSNESDSSEEDAHADSRAQARKRKASGVDYSNQRALAELDRVDLRNSAYTKQKNTLARKGQSQMSSSPASRGYDSPLGRDKHRKNNKPHTDFNKTKKR